jgi:hypothetical protein
MDEIVEISENACGSVSSLSDGWTRVSSVIPVAMLQHRFVSCIQAVLTCRQDHADGPSRRAAVRLGEVKIGAVSEQQDPAAVAATTGLQPSSSMALSGSSLQTVRCTSHFTLDSLTSTRPCGVWMLEWQTPSCRAAAALTVRSYDVWIDDRWQARVLQPYYLLQIRGDSESTVSGRSDDAPDLSSSLLQHAVADPSRAKLIGACELPFSVDGSAAAPVITVRCCVTVDWK